ncbi:hypothetical protein ANN_14855 [Periplaneta americana]|uniref:Uncharacterized protein n=1 Tax=Periplaneta americana TaxID=6978 RepID=A0ABQ8SYU8_PERAM|nr:hypothetical protein ANN_14855 [Periplaneta americana]
MAGLCEGGNEPPGSLKASSKAVKKHYKRGSAGAVDRVPAWLSCRQTRWAADPELRSGLGWILLWTLVSSEVFPSRGTEAGWSMASPWHQPL